MVDDTQTTDLEDISDDSLDDNPQSIEDPTSELIEDDEDESSLESDEDDEIDGEKKKKKKDTIPPPPQEVDFSKFDDPVATFKNKYFIDLTNAIDKYSTPDIKSYPTGISREKMNGYFTVVCNSRFTPRTNVTEHYKKYANTSVLPILVDHGRAIMPDKTARFVYIYQDNLGEPVYDTDKELALGWKTEKILETILIPFVTALKDLQQRDVTHGNIRATNIYDGGDKRHEKFKLGECLSVPGSYNQPVVYEPVERAMADPIGRGTGTIKDDLYALGALMAMHVRNFDPLRGKTDDEIITAKVVTGSYAAMIGSSDRVASGISDLLRGLLTDNEKTRWSLDDVLAWLDGRRQNSKQPIKVKKAARGIEFDGTKFFYARTFAHRLFRKPQDAVNIIEGNELTHWIERSLSDNDMLDRLALAMKSAKEGGAGVGYWDRLIPYVSIALDPEAPLRYKNMSININALGTAMANAFIQKRGLSNYIELFNNGIVYFWISVCGDYGIDVSGYTQEFDKIRGFLRQNDLTSGIERCLYFLNPSIHCLSPVVDEYFATTPVEYVSSLEWIAGLNPKKIPQKIIDKHGACFMVSRDPKLMEKYTYDLASNQEYRYLLACVNVFATIQKHNKLPALPHLTSLIVDRLDPVIERYHDTEQQKRLRQELQQKKESGQLSEIAALIESPDKVKKDQITYRRAIARYRQLEEEKIIINKKLAKPKYFSERTGREWAATISGVISVLIIIGFLFLHFGGVAG